MGLATRAGAVVKAGTSKDRDISYFTVTVSSHKAHASQLPDGCHLPQHWDRRVTTSAQCARLTYFANG